MKSGGIADKSQSQRDLGTKLTSIVKDSLSLNPKHNLKIGDSSDNHALGLNAVDPNHKINDQVNPMAAADYINAQLGNMGLNVNQIV